MNIKTWNENQTLTIAINERLDTLTAPELEKTVKENADKYQKMILDISELEYISSAGLRTLVLAHKLMSAKGGFVVKSPNESVMEIIRLTGLNKFIQIEK